MVNGGQRAQDLARLNAKMSEAVAGVRCAEDELDAAVRSLSPVPVGDKMVITSGLEGSFRRLRMARQQVVDVRELLLKA